MGQDVSASQALSDQSRDALIASYLQASVGIAQVNPDGQFVMANPRFCAIAGRTEEQLKKLRLHDITHEDDRGPLAALIADVYKTSKSLTITQRFLCGTGKTAWVETSVASVQTTNGQADNILIFSNTVTEQKYSARVQDIYEAALLNTPDFVYVMDLKGRFVYANKALLDMWGHTPETAFGRDFLELGYEKWHAAMHQREIQQVIATKKSFRGEVPFHGTHGRRIYDYIFAPVFNKAGEIVSIAGTTRDVTERKEAEQALRQSQEREQFALEASEFVGTWNMDVHTNLVVADERFARLYSVDPVWAARGAPLEEFTKTIHPMDLARVGPAIEKAMKEGGEFKHEYRLVPAGGEVRWVVARGRVDLDELGHPFRFAGAVVDITERKLAEDNLRKSEQEFRELTEVLPQQVWTARADGQLDYVNSHTRNYVGDIPVIDGVVQWTGVVHPDDLAHSMEEWAKSVATGVPYEVQQRVLHKERGQYRWHLSRAVAVRNEEGEITKWFGTNTDIEDQRQAHQAANEAREHLSLMVESAQDYAIISIDPLGRIVSWNNGAERVFGYAPDEVVGQPIGIIFTPEDRKRGIPQNELVTARLKGRAKDERWHQRKNGERFFVSGIMAAMQDNAGQARGFIKIARDSTKEQEAQEAIIGARNAAEAANIAKTEFLANMSHEIRTPMNAVIGLSNILGMSQPLTSKQSEFIKTLQSSADSLLTLINDLLDIAKIEARTVELEQVPFSILRVVQEVISMMTVRAQEKGIAFALHEKSSCDDNKIFVGDPTRLRQILVNLCSNAIKFTETGRIDIDLRCHIAKDGLTETVEFTVRDTGIGIPPEKIGNIFQKFVQADSSINRKYGGTGLGLAITKTLTEVMGGTIEVKSALGKGSTFVVALPFRLADKDALRANTDTSLVGVPNDDTAGARPRILLVEDYAPNVMVATAFLEQFGYTFDVANNGLQAVDKFKSGHYAAILMDVQMHGMNGLEATSVIREYERQTKKARTPIIGMTAHAMSGDRERCLAASMDDYIPKPFKPDELRNIIKRLLVA